MLSWNGNECKPLGIGPNGDGLPRPASLVRRQRTVPAPFSFERRDSARAKSISEIRLEQDLAIAAEASAAVLARPFRANPLPRSTVEPRYEVGRCRFTLSNPR
jgi:protein FAM161A